MNYSSGVLVHLLNFTSSRQLDYNNKFLCAKVRPMTNTRRLAVVCLHTCPWERPGEGSAGGMNVYVRQTAAELAARGWEVDIYTRVHERTGAHGNFPTGVELIHLPAGPICTNKEDLSRWIGPFVEEVAAGERQYDAVLSHYWLSGLAAIELSRRWQIPHLASFHTLSRAKQAAHPAGTEPVERANRESHIVEHADRLLAVSLHERQALMDLYGANRNVISVACPGTDPDRFHCQSRQEARDRLGLSPGNRIVLAVGRPTPIKGFEVLLGALARIEDPRVIAIFVGGRSDCTFRSALQQLAVEFRLGHRVRFIGSLDQEFLPDYYAACDLCVVPSHYESFGMVAQESIACGRPVVASRVGGLEAIVSDSDAGVLVPPGTVNELADAIQSVLRDRSGPRTRNPSTRQIPSWSNTADAILAAVNEVVSCTV